MTGIDQFASLIVGLRADDTRTMDKLRLHVADTLCAWIGATGTPEGQSLIRFRRQHRSGDRLADDIATHCAITRLSEIDDIHLASMTTPGSIVIPAAMTLAASLHDVDTDDIAAAMLAGYEAMVRFGLAVKGPNILYRGIWPTYFGSGFATAAVAARLWRMPQPQTAHALALALTMASPSVGQHHAVTTARWFSIGNSARTGLTAALAARSGFTADLEVLRSRLLPDVYGIEPDITVMVDNNLRALPNVSLKPWCAARQTMAATQGLREILETGVRAGEISEITAYVLPPHLKMIDHGITPGNRASYLTSLPYQLTLAALQPACLAGLNLANEAPPLLLQAFMARVKVVADETLLADYPTHWPARIVVEAASGRRELRINYIPGDPERPFTTADVETKFKHFTAAALGDATEHFLQMSMTALQSVESFLSLMRDLDGVMVRAMT